MITKIHTFIFLAGISLIVSACSTSLSDKATRKNNQISRTTERLLDSSERPLPSQQWPVKVSDDVYVGGEAIMLRRGKPLPISVEDGTLNLFTSDRVPMAVVANMISRNTGIPVSLSNDINVEDQIVSVQLDYQGKLSVALNDITLKMGLNWKYDGLKIFIYRNETITYMLKLLPSKSSGEAKVSSAVKSDGDDGASQSGLVTSSEYEIDLWSELVESITTIVGDSGKLSSSKSMGTISITGNANLQSRVEKYILSQNKRLSKQVAVNVQVFNVSISDSSELATDLVGALAKSDLGVNFNVDKTSGLSNNTSMSWTLLNPISSISNLSGVVKFLNSKGDVSVVTTANATTLNNVPTPINVGNRRAYVSEITVETDEFGNQVEGFVTEEVATGFNMQLLPRVIGGEDVALQYSITTSELVGANDGFDSYVGASGSVQLPNVNTRAFTQQVMIPSGSTLVLSGFEQTKSRSDKEGVGSANNWLFGGKKVGVLERDVMVIMITPTILQDGNVIIRTD
jgi:type IVB pilus formation R64 PilN family outer membrane protein